MIDAQRFGDSAPNALDEIRVDLRQIREQQALLLESVNFCSNKISDFEKELSRLNDYIKNTDQFFNENKVIKKDMETRQLKINDLDQAARSNNIKIQGVPEKNNKEIGIYIDNEVRPAAIDYVHRVKVNHNSPNVKAKNIIVRFTSMREKERFLMAVKTKRIANGSSPKMPLDGISDAFYIIEHLTSANKILFKEVSLAAKNKEYKYVWVKYGVIFCRQSDSSRIIAIKNQDSIKCKLCFTITDHVSYSSYSFHG
nr:uncharacterized protein LOC111505291 [Leptinotarsa decemlineata]